MSDGATIEPKNICGYGAFNLGALQRLMTLVKSDGWNDFVDYFDARWQSDAMMALDSRSGESTDPTKVAIRRDELAGASLITFYLAAGGFVEHLTVAHDAMKAEYESQKYTKST